MWVPRLRNTYKCSVILSNSIATQFFASFHKGNKFSTNLKGGQSKTPSKNEIRLVTRQRRADAKKALEDFLNKSCSSKYSFLEEESKLKWKVGLADNNSNNLNSKQRSKSSARRTKKPQQKKNKRKSRRDRFSESFDDYHETITHKMNSRYESFFRKAEPERKENLNSRSWGGSSSDSVSEESDDDMYNVGSCANRALLGLPPNGPLKIQDVKKAFHVSALKWHPDRHQGQSQDMAEEKFKQCVDAYKSLCNLITTS